jgi:hypothetical protein
MPAQFLSEPGFQHARKLTKCRELGTSECDNQSNTFGGEIPFNFPFLA